MSPSGNHHVAMVDLGPIPARSAVLESALKTAPRIVCEGERNSLGLGYVQVQPGDTWYVQLWYRDTVSGTSTSNFSDAIEAIFR